MNTTLTLPSASFLPDASIFQDPVFKRVYSSSGTKYTVTNDDTNWVALTYVHKGTTGSIPSSTSVPLGSVAIATDTTPYTLYINNGSGWVQMGIPSGGAGTVTSVAVAGSTGLTVSGSPITSSGTITLTLGTELQAISGLSTTGLVTRTAAGNYITRVLNSGTGISITNGGGNAGNPTISLSTVTDSGTGTFLKITTDTYGRVTGTTPVVASDITSLVDSTYVNVAGDTMTGALDMSSHNITSVSTLVIGSSAAISTELLSVIGTNAGGNVIGRITNRGTTASSSAELRLSTYNNAGAATTTSIRSNAEDTSGNTSLIFAASSAGTQTDFLKITHTGSVQVLSKAVFGYASTNTGGSVTQSTSKTTGVTLNAPTGQIVLNASSISAATTISFTLTNAYITATSNVIVNRVSGGTAATYFMWCDSVAAGSCVIAVRNQSNAAKAESFTLQFSVISGSSA